MKRLRNVAFVVMIGTLLATAQLSAAANACDSAVVGSTQNWPNTIAGSLSAFAWGAGVDCGSGACGPGCAFTGQKDIWVHTITWEGQQVLDAQVGCSCVPEM